MLLKPLKSALFSFFPPRLPRICSLFLSLAPLLFLLFTVSGVFAMQGRPLDFDIFRLGAGDPVVLVIGGIQGDEPGGFSAATLLATRYEISKGSVWVVPNLNFPSIVKRSRGLHGDMNRKFAFLDEKDPEYSTVRRIQDVICHPDVRLVLNLHDGSGYYRPGYESRLKNPSRWGQSIIIDQENMDGDIFMGRLGDHAREVASSVNRVLANPLHKLHVHNTNTAAGDKEMEKSLSYYAMRHDKAAFGLEATKECGVADRTFFHLNMVENFLRLAGVEFTRGFELTPPGIETALREHLGVAFAGNRVFIPLEDARPSINCFPLPKSGASAITSKPIMAVLPCKDGLCIHYGNRRLTLIKPDWRDMEDSIESIPILVDGQEQLASFGQIVDVRQEARVKKVKGARVNAIGLASGREDESDLPLRHRQFEKKYSLDKSGKIFRVEVYKGSKFAGMFLLRFIGKNDKKLASRAAKALLPDRGGPESTLGF